MPLPRIGFYVTHHDSQIATKIMMKNLSTYIANQGDKDIYFVGLHYKNGQVCVTLTTPTTELPLFLQNREYQPLDEFLVEFAKIRDGFSQRYWYVEANLNSNYDATISKEVVSPLIIPFINEGHPDLLTLFTQTPVCAANARNFQEDRGVHNSAIKFTPSCIDVLNLAVDKIVPHTHFITYDTNRKDALSFIQTPSLAINGLSSSDLCELQSTPGEQSPRAPEPGSPRSPRSPRSPGSVVSLGIYSDSVQRKRLVSNPNTLQENTENISSSQDVRKESSVSVSNLGLYAHNTESGLDLYDLERVVATFNDRT